MLGGMFAGHDESGGETVDRNGRQYKLFYGMSSATAMKRYAGGIAEYRSVITNTHTHNGLFNNCKFQTIGFFAVITKEYFTTHFFALSGLLKGRRLRLSTVAKSVIQYLTFWVV